MGAILFDDFSDMKPFLGSAFSDIALESLESNLNNSKPDIELMTGKELLKDLIDAYEAGTMTEEQENLLPYIRKPLVNMCFFRHSNQGSININDSGYTASESETTKRPYQWQIRNFQRQCLNDYADGMKELWEYLHENVADFSDWPDTEQYIYLQQKPINELQEWAKSGRRIANWRTHYALLPEMGMVWDDLANDISTALWEDFNQELLDGFSPENEALLPYIQRYLAHATIARAAKTLPLSFEAEGIFLKEVASTTANSDVAKQESDRAAVQKQASQEAKAALCRLIKFLDDNATEDTYSGYYNEFIEGEEELPKLNNEGDKLIFM